ncbi:hypothetical protein CLV46_1663 [Diaminobutyricimonas aerilata]|uniref:Uncharacterized protein n=1 Tax=Diaminobutyricimonas aerilata TaxID=1162967 RepID=A0A2M9CJM3_9MICO|nr:hypothetical protein [Diaminobutyricimonas aerilata]PJJ72099.1 hypothetical protein CLV46_1663 [Diaminobutyricimonas aerilata]
MDPFLATPASDDDRWLADRLDSNDAMHCVVPRRFEAYARVFPPVHRRRFDPDGWAMIDEQRMSWAQIADETGTVAHPLMQWDRIAPSSEERDGAGRVTSTAEPQPGWAPVELVQQLVRLLLPHTSTPDAVVAGMWEGYGELREGGSWQILLWAGDGPAPEPPPRTYPELAYPTLALPQRSHHLFTADGRAVATGDPAEWFTGIGRAPSLVWPHDRSWTIVSEVDWDTVVVAGSRAAIDAVLADDTLETAEIPAGADLSSLGDRINPARTDNPSPPR